METVTVTRRLPAPPDRVEEAILDVEAFMRAAGFDAVTVTGDTIRIENTVGLFLKVALVLERVERSDAVFAYQQRDGIFKEMTTTYHLEPDTDTGTRVTGRTQFALAPRVIGPVFDATVVRRMRTRELNNQFDHLEALP